MCVEVEVVDAPIDYNLLLGRSWTYAMQAVVATIFRVLLFPHEGRIVTIYQLSFSRLDPALGASTVPMVDNPQAGVFNIGFGLCPSLMGTFNYPPPQGDVKLYRLTIRLRFSMFRRSARITFRIRGLFLPHQIRWMRQGMRACLRPCRPLN
jgi:hypothetical protein